MKVPVGISTIIGYLTLALGLLPIVIKTIEEGQVAFNGPEKWLAIGGIIMGAITAIGRYIQSHAVIKAGGGQ
jgi:hypothetical protein